MSNAMPNVPVAIKSILFKLLTNVKDKHVWRNVIEITLITGRMEEKVHQSTLRILLMMLPLVLISRLKSTVHEQSTINLIS